jgi:hypothetical protein
MERILPSFVEQACGRPGDGVPIPVLQTIFSAEQGFSDGFNVFVDPKLLVINKIIFWVNNGGGGYRIKVLDIYFLDQ